MIYLGMSDEERSQLRHAARQSKDLLGFCMKAEHRNGDGKLLDPGLWMPNSIPNQGYDTIWNVYFKGGTQPSGASAFGLGLVASITSGWSLTTVIGDMVAVTGTSYALINVNATTDWTISGNPEVAAVAAKVFTAGGTWTTAIGAYLTAQTAVKLLCYDAFAAGRTLYNTDTLTVTLTLTREAATE